MQDNSANSRDFNSMSVAGLSDEARQAVNTDFDAMGWPEQIVDATSAQLQSITKMQIQMIDQMMDIWEEQIKSPNPMTASSAMLSKLKSPPGASPAGTWPNANAFAGAAMNPMQFWVQVAEQWQKAWADAMGAGQRRR
jgi:hypothetical protein